MDTTKELMEAWDKSARASFFLLDLLDEEEMGLAYAPRVRTIAKTFIHLHNTRVMWLEANKVNPEGLRKIGKREELLKDEIRAQLEISAEAVKEMLESRSGKGKIAGFKGGMLDFLTYLVAHEAHHRGQIMVALRISGRRPSQDAVYAMWDWK